MGYSTGSCGYSSRSCCGGLERLTYSSQGSSSNYSRSNSNVGLNYMIAAEPVVHTPSQSQVYQEFDNIKNEVYSDNYRSVKRASQTYSHVLDDFLNPLRSTNVFIGEASEIREFTEQAFKSVTGRDFPDDIIIHLVSEKEMQKIHPRNVVGFALNRRQQGLMSEVFVKKDTLDRVMVILGHELGHVLTKRLPDEKDEEAKAFAFSLAWMKKIKQENIANLSTSILIDRPAQNGIHNVALDFVMDLVAKGKEAYDVWINLAKGLIKIGGALW